MYQTKYSTTSLYMPTCFQTTCQTRCSSSYSRSRNFYRVSWVEVCVLRLCWMNFHFVLHMSAK